MRVMTMMRALTPVMWIPLWLALGIYSSWLTWRGYESRTLAHNMQQRTQANYQQQRSILLAAKAAAFAHLGRTVRWPALPTVAEPAGAESSRPRVRLVLVLDEVSCDTCQNYETQWSNVIAAKAGPGAVVAIVAATHERFAASYARVNRSQFSVLFDRERLFIKANDIKTAPLLLLVNEHNTIIAADAPVPDHPDSSDAFHTACERMFGLGT